MDAQTPPNLPEVAQPQQPRKRNRNSKKQRGEGYSAPKLSDAYRGRQLLNADTIREMHAAFREGGRAAIDKVMKNQPAIFLKLLVLLVPRELQIEHRGGVKGMTEDQIVDAIEAIEGFLARRSGEQAKVIEGSAEGNERGKPEEKPKS
jgi:hypothetical protein